MRSFLDGIKCPGAIVSTYLQVFVIIIRHHDISRHQMELRVQRILVVLIMLELFHTISLTQPASQYSSHTLHSTLC